jgi:hypothetical protein
MNGTMKTSDPSNSSSINGGKDDNKEPLLRPCVSIGLFIPLSFLSCITDHFTLFSSISFPEDGDSKLL